MNPPLAAVPPAPRAMSRNDLAPATPLNRPPAGPPPGAFGPLLTRACDRPSLALATERSRPAGTVDLDRDQDPADAERSTPAGETDSEPAAAGPTPLAVLTILTVLATPGASTSRAIPPAAAELSLGVVPDLPTETTTDTDPAPSDVPPANPRTGAAVAALSGGRPEAHRWAPATSAPPPNPAPGTEPRTPPLADGVPASLSPPPTPDGLSSLAPALPDPGGNRSGPGSSKNPPSPTPPAPSPGPPTGTSSASEEPRMNKALETDRTAGLDEQELPPARSLTSAEGTPDRPVSRGTRGTGRGSAESDGSSVNPPVASSFAGPAAATSLGAGEVGAPALGGPPSTPDLSQRLSTLIAGATVHLRQLGREDFEVTIQPEPGMEILLRVSLQGGGTEVQAELRRGDAAAVHARWQELQDRLAQQGIKLAGLALRSDPPDREGGASGGFAGRHPGNPDHPPGTGHHPHSLSRTPNHPPASIPHPLRSGRGQGHRWETWA